MAILNRHQPVRPRHDDNGHPLLYTTRPKEGKRIQKLVSRDSMIIQSRLYRAVRAGKIPIRVAIGELYEFLFYDEAVKKNSMGEVVTSTTIYEPRMLVNSRLAGGAHSCYNFSHMKDLEYGLEWMICLWLRRFLNESGARDREVVGPEMMAEELDRLAEVDDQFYYTNYESQYLSFPEPDWPKLLIGVEEWVPPKQEKLLKAPVRTELRDYSKLRNAL